MKLDEEKKRERDTIYKLCSIIIIIVYKGKKGRREVGGVVGISILTVKISVVVPLSYFSPSSSEEHNNLAAIQ